MPRINVRRAFTEGRLRMLGRIKGRAGIIDAIKARLHDATDAQLAAALRALGGGPNLHAAKVEPAPKGWSGGEACKPERIE